jgi:hypothetical protein
MTVDVFWQRIETAIVDGEECEICPVQEYADEKGDDERFCDKVGDCADGLKMLCKHLEQEV